MSYAQKTRVLGIQGKFTSFLYPIRPLSSVCGQLAEILFGMWERDLLIILIPIFLPYCIFHFFCWGSALYSKRHNLTRKLERMEKRKYLRYAMYKLLHQLIFTYAHLDPLARSPSLRCQTEGRYVQVIPNGKNPCPDFLAFKIAYVQIFVRSKPRFVRSKIENLCVRVQTNCAFVNQGPEFR